MKYHNLKKYTCLNHFSQSDSTLHIGGISIADVLKAYDTPLYVYDFSSIQHNYNLLLENFPQFDIFFSIKANPSLAICSFLSQLKCGAELASDGELSIALKAGFQPENIVFAGPAKTDGELTYAINAGIASVNVESFGELERLNDIAKRLGKSVDVCLRVNTKLSEVTTKEVMAGGSSRFGIDEEKIFERLDPLNYDYINFVGIHVYTASGILDVDAILRNFERTLRVASRLRESGFPIEIVDVGGGFGVPYLEDDEELDIALLGDKTEKLLQSFPELSDARKILELGRFLMAQSGVFLTRVMDVKCSRGKTFVATDGGMNNFFRPILMEHNHPTFVVNKLGKPETDTVNIGGPICTPIDVIGKDVSAPDVEEGDVIGYFNAGAYGYSMSMHNFLSHPNPPEVAIYGGESYLIRERATLEDIFEGQDILILR
jgi:diaminopimelate decarboxylase